MMGVPRLANQGPLKFMPGGCWESADVAFASGKRGMGLKGEREREMRCIDELQTFAVGTKTNEEVLIWKTAAGQRMKAWCPLLHASS